MRYIIVFARCFAFWPSRLLFGSVMGVPIYFLLSLSKASERRWGGDTWGETRARENVGCVGPFRVSVFPDFRSSVVPYFCLSVFPCASPRCYFHCHLGSFSFWVSQDMATETGRPAPSRSFLAWHVASSGPPCRWRCPSGVWRASLTQSRSCASAAASSSSSSSNK